LLALVSFFPWPSTRQVSNKEGRIQFTSTRIKDKLIGSSVRLKAKIYRLRSSQVRFVGGKDILKQIGRSALVTEVWKSG